MGMPEEMSQQQISEHIGTEKYLARTEGSIDRAKEKIRQEALTREYVSYSSYPIALLKDSTEELVRSATGNMDLVVPIEPPPEHIDSDIALSFFDAAKVLRKSPIAIASAVAVELKNKEFKYLKSGEPENAFLNVGLEREAIYRDTITQAIELGDRFGSTDVNKGEVAVIDFSAPNIAKPFGVSHLRSTIIGQSLSRIYEATGHTVIRDNHLGDWGTQFGKLMYGYEQWGQDIDLENDPDPISTLNKLYTKFEQTVKDSPELINEARQKFAKLEEGDPIYLALWDKFIEVSLDNFEEVYNVLGIEFDTEIGESYFVRDAKRVTQEIIDSGLAEKDESGAIVVDFKNQVDLPSFLIEKADGSTLYASRDLATIKFRKKEFDPQSIVYVVGGEQALNFRQVFELSQRMGYSEGIETKHVGFGMILVDGKKMSTRRGTLIPLNDLIEKSISGAKEIIKKKNPNILDEEVDGIATKVGLGAIYYNDLSQSRMKDISFDWEKMLDFEGGSAAYLQYTFVRIGSIINKVEDDFLESKIDIENITFEDRSEFDIALKIMQFPEIILKAREKDSPHFIATYLEELCKLFNTFYNKVSIIRTEDEALKASRVALSKSTAIVIKNGLRLLNISTVDKM